MGKKLKSVVFVSHSGHFYGSEKCLLDIVKNLSDSYAPIVFLPSNGILYEELKKHYIETHVITYRGWLYDNNRFKSLLRWALNFIAICRILYIIRNKAIFLVYSNTFYTPIGLVIAKILSIPHILHFHSFPEKSNFDLGLTLSMKIMKWGCMAIITPSYALSLSVVKYFPNVLFKVIPNGYLPKYQVSQGPKDPCFSSTFRILMVGSISSNKGQLILLKAFNNLISSGLDVELTIVGGCSDYSYMEKITEFVALNTLHDNIKICNFSKNIEDYYIENNALICCSEHESFGRVIIEAMAHGCPVIASRIPSSLELINENVDGLLFERDSYNELSAKIKTLMCDKDLQKKLASNGRIKFAEKFTLDKYISSVNELFNNILD